jgi:hypothetical protein
MKNFENIIIEIINPSSQDVIATSGGMTLTTNGIYGDEGFKALDEFINE